MSAGISLATVAAGVGIAGGIKTLMADGSEAPSGGGTTAGGTVYDPFAQYRSQFGSQLAGMMSPGASFGTSDPSYDWRFNQGLEAVNRTAAAKGQLGSGNRLQELMKYGQGMASTEFGAQFGRLSSLAGVGTTMGSNQGALAQQQEQTGWNAVGQGLGSLAGTWDSSANTSAYSGSDANMTGFQSDPWSAQPTSQYSYLW